MNSFRNEKGLFCSQGLRVCPGIESSNQIKVDLMLVTSVIDLYLSFGKTYILGKSKLSNIRTILLVHTY